MFEELLQSVREGGAILRGERESLSKVTDKFQASLTILKKESEKQTLINLLSEKNAPLMFFYDEEPGAEIPYAKVGEFITLVHPPYNYETLESWLRLGNWQAISPENDIYQPLSIIKMKANEIEQHMKEYQVAILIDAFHDNTEWAVYQR
jgi:hypothetical protein